MIVFSCFIWSGTLFGQDSLMIRKAFKAEQDKKYEQACLFFDSLTKSKDHESIAEGLSGFADVKFKQGELLTAVAKYRELERKELIEKKDTSSSLRANRYNRIRFLKYNASIFLSEYYLESNLDSAAYFLNRAEKNHYCWSFCGNANFADAFHRDYLKGNICYQRGETDTALVILLPYVLDLRNIIDYEDEVNKDDEFLDLLQKVLKKENVKKRDFLKAVSQSTRSGKIWHIKYDFTFNEIKYSVSSLGLRIYHSKVKRGKKKLRKEYFTQKEVTKYVKSLPALKMSWG